MPRKMVNTEEAVCMRIARYLQDVYPNVLYHFDFGSGTKLSIGQAKRQKALNKRGFVDLFIYEPRNGYSGLAVEVKKEGINLYRRDGNLYSNPHLKEQADILNTLAMKGYKAEFGVGYEQIIQIIDKYLFVFGIPYESLGVK